MESRFLAIYSNSNERHVIDVKFETFDIIEFRSRFKAEGDELMYDSYEVVSNNVAFVKSKLPKNVNIQWENSDLSFFIECREK